MILTGWKEIAAHLRRGVRTTQRWESRGLPVKRVANTPRAPVVADSDELDAWTLRNPIIIGASSPELRATIERARKLRAEAQQARQALHRTMETLRRELALLRKKAQFRERIVMGDAPQESKVHAGGFA